MMNVWPRNACTYGAAARIQCTNARIVAEFAGGVSSGARGARAITAEPRQATDEPPPGPANEVSVGAVPFVKRAIIAPARRL